MKIMTERQENVLWTIYRAVDNNVVAELLYVGHLNYYQSFYGDFGGREEEQY